MADFRRKIELARLLLTLWASVSQEGSRSNDMINFTNIRKNVAASVSALFISTLFVVAAVGNPAAATAPSTSQVQAQA
jgi:hypothetical protein